MIVAIIQARMRSTRLPGKVLKKVGGKPLLQYQIERIRKSRLPDKIVVATSVLADDDRIEKFCQDNGIECFRGSEHDVLGRYYKCAQYHNADIVVRLTADCPLIDPKLMDKIIQAFQVQHVDFASNTVPSQTSTFPDGSDVEVFSMQALERAHRECQSPSDREHVTHYLWKSGSFKTHQLRTDENFSDFRFTVDYPEDIKVIEYLIGEIEQRKIFGYWQEIIEILRSAPEREDMNSRYRFKKGRQNDTSKNESRE